MFFVGLEISAGRLQELKKLLGSLDSSSFFSFFSVSREWHRLELVEKGHLPVWGPSMSANLVEAGYMTEAQKSRVAEIGQNVFVSYLVVDDLRSPTASN